MANVAFKNQKVVSFGASFVKPSQWFKRLMLLFTDHGGISGSVAAAQPKLTKEVAIAKAEQVTGGKYNKWPTALEVSAMIIFKCDFN